MKRKIRLIWQIFPVFFAIIALSLSAIGSYFPNYFKKILIEEAEKELLIKTELLLHNFSDMPVPVFNMDKKKDIPNYKIAFAYQNINKECRSIGRKTGVRVTVILPSGKVIGDSFSEAASMESHADRPEVIAAMSLKEGTVTRYSTTLEKDMMYAALPLIRNGKTLSVIRTSTSLAEINKKLESIRNNTLLAIFITLILAAIASFLTARQIIRPVREMKKAAGQFAKGNLNYTMPAPEAQELSELALSMNHMAEKLDKKMKDFENHSRELEAVHTSMQEGLIALNPNERIITINPAAAAMFGFKANELKNHYIMEAARNVDFQNFIKKAMRTPEPVYGDIVIPGDRDMVLHLHSSALFDINNKRMGTLIIFHDITHIKHLEKMHKEFAANVSHELKTPLTTIKGFIETLRTMPERTHSKEAVRFISIIENNVNRMTAIIDDLLSLARLERLQTTSAAVFETTSLSCLIHNAADECELAARAKNIRIQKDCPDNIILMADPILMEQAVFNLVDNAVKYSEENQSVQISAWKSKETLTIEVRDSGCGISKEHLPNIFKRFYRVDKSRSRHQGGTGLGLAIVKHIIQYHQGTIDVQSEKEQGTKFVISLPF